MSLKLTELVWKTELNLLPGEHHVLLCLAYFANDKKDLLCCPKISTIAKRCHLSTRQTIRILKHLNDAGIITKISHKDNSTETSSNSYIINEKIINGEEPERSCDMVSHTRCHDVTSLGDMVSPNNDIYNNIRNKVEKKLSTDSENSAPEPAFLPSLLDTAKAVLSLLRKKTGRRYVECDSNLKPIIALLKKGITEQQCKQVIVRKHRDWGNDSRMEKYLRPVTLFNRTNFYGKYLPECVSEVEKKEIMEGG